MTSLKSYLIRSIYEWIVDNNMTPYLLVNVEHPEAVLPEGFAEDGQMILNIRPAAVQNLILGDEDIEFNAQFSGRPRHIIAPVTAILAIYAEENGRGMAFDPSEDLDDILPPKSKTISKKPQLRIVK